MPQMVSMFNAMGGGCALLLGLLEADAAKAEFSTWIMLAAGTAIGGVSFAGSIIAYLKLDGKKVDVQSSAIRLLVMIFPLVLIALIPIMGKSDIDAGTGMLIIALTSLLYGAAFVLPIGGADMPVVISLLNSFTGMAAGVAGLVYNNNVMIVGGILVGAAGVLLTLLMCKAMNRSIFNVLIGTFKSSGSGASGSGGAEGTIKEIGAEEIATSLAYSGKVAIIPGYGLAVAQAQHACHQLEKLLEEAGVEVSYIIHPVAGRMPGHMNVLLAESDVAYEKLVDMEEVNDEMNTFDVAIIIGANDVVNPAAETDKGSKIYGMPIIRAHQAKQVVVIKRSMGKGYAGIENDLFYYQNCRLFFADAKKGLNEIVSQLKNI